MDWMRSHYPFVDYNSSNSNCNYFGLAGNNQRKCLFFVNHDVQLASFTMMLYVDLLSHININTSGRAMRC